MTKWPSKIFALMQMSGKLVKLSQSQSSKNNENRESFFFFNFSPRITFKVSQFSADLRKSMVENLQMEGNKYFLAVIRVFENK